jgi:DNA helicase-2/ATP-dependent DNA helicase PcrA
MIDAGTLVRAVASFRPGPDPEQLAAIGAPPGAGVFIVAGPGTGKTASLTLRILKLVLVDGIPPSAILATTFTRKAAAELRSRVLGWGFQVIERMRADRTLDGAVRTWLRSLDINQVRTGTTDSTCEQLLREFRAPGTEVPSLADAFTAQVLMLRDGLFDEERHRDEPFGVLLGQLNGGTYGLHAGRKARLVGEIWGRRLHDLVDWDRFASGDVDARARETLGAAHRAYEESLGRRGLVDFPGLGREVLARLRDGTLEGFTAGLRAVLVDEYQDTNLQQEALYFALAEACGGALTVVGDDDQSLYRFRGATVDLFRDFPQRYEARFGRQPEVTFLTRNYRSTGAVVGLVNDYVGLDPKYGPARVAGKPPLVARSGVAPGLPPLGMFRDTPEELADDLARLVHDVFRGNGFASGDVRIARAPSGGDVGDCALLCASPRETTGGERARVRLPRRLREALGALDPPIRTFNPRGEPFGDVPVVALLGGLLAECLDPGGAVQATMLRSLSPDAVRRLDAWRAAACAHVEDSGAALGLKEYAVRWANRDTGRPGYEWPRSTPVLKLLYDLVAYLPGFHDDPEAQVYLETFARQVGACEQVGTYGARVVRDDGERTLGAWSVAEVIRLVLEPIADDLVEVDEDLMDTFPRDRLSILSIHQAKGLEFPLVIVDVGSDFRTNHHSQAFHRMPTKESTEHRMEDLLRPLSPLGVPDRDALDRAFDDLTRKYFVAFSRAQDVLLVVGLTKAAPGGAIQNVATGTRRDSTRGWASGGPFRLI